MVRPLGNQQRVEQNYTVLLKACRLSTVKWVKLEPSFNPQMSFSDVMTLILVTFR